MISIPRHAEFICSPEFFYSEATQAYLSNHIQGTDRQWIYKLSGAVNEEIYIDTDEWILAKDKHPGNDLRFLIVYKNRDLRSIRDLRQSHVNMLLESKQTSMRYIQKHISPSSSWMVYFHYYPSVFQLHAHIASFTTSRNQDRIHYMHNVIANLAHNSNWYRDALILTRCTRFVHTLVPCLQCEYGVRDASGNPTQKPTKVGEGIQHQYLCVETKPIDPTPASGVIADTDSNGTSEEVTTIADDRLPGTQI